MPANVVDTTDAIVQRLRAIVRESPDLKHVAQVYEAILPLLHNATCMPESPRERMHVEVCDACTGYFKGISAFTPTPPEMLPAEDLATRPPDYIAQEHGYMLVAVQ
jgi:hypothetical protein